MKTLDEYNKDRLKAISEAKKKAHLSGILCPKCKKSEMIFPNPYMVLASAPPQKNVQCPECGHSGYMVV